jgi:hypothetical protein
VAVEGEKWIRLLLHLRGCICREGSRGARVGEIQEVFRLLGKSSPAVNGKVAKIALVYAAFGAAL